MQKAYKPHKGMLKRFKVTGTGKLKRRNTLSGHLRSVRTGAHKRRIGKPQIMFEGHAKNLRLFMGASKKNPNKVRHERALQVAQDNHVETAVA
jgi:large subunit ribosomal protein L35